MSSVNASKTAETEPKTGRAPAAERPRQPILAGPQADILALQDAAGNRAVGQSLQSGMEDPPPGRNGIPPVVQSVLSGGGGRPLEPATRALMESRFGHDFSQVQVHTDAQAARSARFLGALAYTAGHDIVFAPGQYAPETPTGRWMLAHELAHVAQMRSALGTPRGISHPGEQWESDASQAAVSVGHGNSYPVATGAPALVRMLVDPRLEQYRTKIRELSVRYRGHRTEIIVERLFKVLTGLDLSDSDNLVTVTWAVADALPSDVLLLFLEQVEAVPAQRGYPTTEEIQLVEQQTRGMRLSGGTKHLGPRVPGFFPYAGATAEAIIFSPATAVITHVSGSVGSFLGGMSRELSKIKDKDLHALQDLLLDAAILTTVFPPVFAAGAGVGIIEDFGKAVIGVVEILGDIYAFVESIVNVIKIIFSPECKQVAWVMGEEAGRHLAGEISKLVNLNALEFTFELGRLVGPAIVYTVLALLGYPAIIGAMIFARLMPILRHTPTLMRLIKAIGRFVKPRPDRGVDFDPDIDIEAAPAKAVPTKAPPPKAPPKAQQKKAATIVTEAATAREISRAQRISIGKVPKHKMPTSPPGTTVFGDKMHDLVDPLVREKWPGLEFSRTPRGVEGPDMRVPGGGPEFDWIEIKPDTPSGVNTFVREEWAKSDVWSGRGRLVVYDSQGNVKLIDLEMGTK